MQSHDLAVLVCDASNTRAEEKKSAPLAMVHFLLANCGEHGMPKGSLSGVVTKVRSVCPLQGEGYENVLLRVRDRRRPDGCVWRRGWHCSTHDYNHFAPQRNRGHSLLRDARGLGWHPALPLEPCLGRAPGRPCARRHGDDFGHADDSRKLELHRPRHRFRIASAIRHQSVVDDRRRPRRASHHHELAPRCDDGDSLQ